MTTPTARTIKLNCGLNYHVLEWNAKAAAARHTVVLVHGFLGLAHGWQRTVAAWLENHPDAADELHFVAPDMRGHGDSDRIGTGGYYHFLDYLGDLHDVVGQLGRDRISLVGHSMGGTICSYYAGSFADSVYRLATLEGLGPPEPSVNMPSRVRSWLASWRRAQNKVARGYEDIAAAAERLMKHDPRLARDLALELAEYGARVREGDGLYVFKHDPVHVTMGPYPFRLDQAEQFWNAITCPVLSVAGSESTFLVHRDEGARRLAMFATVDGQQSGRRQVEVKVLDGAGHMMQRHQPVALAAMLDGFLRG